MLVQNKIYEDFGVGAVSRESPASLRVTQTRHIVY
jgi:hypothetical protein